MANFKYVNLRYETIDKCLSNTRKTYCIDDLVNACNKAIQEKFATSDGERVKKRQIYYDLKYLKEHYEAPIARERDGHKMIISYSDPDFSIRKRPLSQNDMMQLKDTLTLLNRFKGMPQFEWIEDLVNKLAIEFNLNENNRKPYVGFAQNEVMGLGYFSPILDAILAKQVITFRYKPMDKKEMNITISPHYLKQYNHRWYVLGYEEGKNMIPIYALDRIIGEVKINRKQAYKESQVNYETYFDDIIGVTHYRDSKLEEIIMQVDKDYIPYFESNPIHETLRPVKDRPGCYKIKVRYNLELANTIFAHLDKIKILQDPSGKLTKELRRRWKEAEKNL